MARNCPPRAHHPPGWPFAVAALAAAPAFLLFTAFFTAFAVSIATGAAAMMIGAALTSRFSVDFSPIVLLLCA
jgi:hypothetical protein